MSVCLYVYSLYADLDACFNYRQKKNLVTPQGDENTKGGEAQFSITLKKVQLFSKAD